ncbi:TolC family protein [Legionella fairfieldensis]|uniref:TolC family protein n=1 Tax=Legionella fairfieldensis TaxID=45064 RepID=UPI00048DED8B
MTRTGSGSSRWFPGLSLFLLIPFVFATPALTIGQLTKIAIQNNNDLKAAQYNIALAKARLVQAGLWPNPSLNLADIDDRWLTHEGEYTRSGSFSQAFPVSGRISKQKDVARIDIAIALAEVRNAKRQLKGMVADYYYAILITDRRLKQLKTLLAINKKLVQVTQNRFQAAEVSELDTNTASLEFQRIRQEKQLLENLRISQTTQLNQLLGREATAPVVLDQTLPLKAHLPPTLSEIQALAIKQRPDMQMLWFNVNRAKANQQLARSERWADWLIGIGVQQNKLVVQGAPPQIADRAVSIGVTIPLPLLNSNQGRIMEAGLAGTQALKKIQALQLTIQTEIVSSYTQLKTLQDAIKLAQMNTVKLTARNVTLARNAYKNGQISLLEVLQIQRQQNDLQTAYLNMLEKYVQALVQFCTSIGHGDNALCPYLTNKRNLYAFTRHS